MALIKFKDLPSDVQNILNKKRDALIASSRSTATEILLYNSTGTRYFYAKRHSRPTRYMSFGGGNYWEVHYGEVIFYKKRIHTDMFEWDFRHGKTFGKVNGIEIPKELDRKAQIIEIINKIGIFDLSLTK